MDVIGFFLFESWCWFDRVFVTLFSILKNGHDFFAVFFEFLKFCLFQEGCNNDSREGDDGIILSSSN